MLSALKCLVEAESALEAAATMELELELGMELELELELELARKTKVFVSIVDTKVFEAVKSSLLAPGKHYECLRTALESAFV